MNPKKCLYDTGISVQPPYIAGHSLNLNKINSKLEFSFYRNGEKEFICLLCRRWYDRIDKTVILGALPFRSAYTEKVRYFK